MADFSLLRNQIHGTVLLPDQEGFDEALKRWAVNAERKAGVVVFVTSAADVSATASVFRGSANSQIKFAKANSIPLTVRGGGHSVSGASSIEGGLISLLPQRI